MCKNENLASGCKVESFDPYIISERVVVDRLYNPNYGDDRVCECGHKYYRHFDTYEDMKDVGCKYCCCFEFKEKISNQ